MKASQVLCAALAALCTLALVQATFVGNGGRNAIEAHEAQTYDGWYNNLAHPDWGGADMVLTRRLPPAYSDGVYRPSGINRPNPRAISYHTMRGETGLPPILNRSALMVFFGQQVVEEILDAQLAGCIPEYFNIPIPAGDPEFDPEGDGNHITPLLRGRFSYNTGMHPGIPREQLNEITPWFDGGLAYGSFKAWADALRAFENGFLAREEVDPLWTNSDINGNCDRKYVCSYPRLNRIGLPMANPPTAYDHKLHNVRRFNMLGNPRGNENPSLLAMGIMQYRLHNHFAYELTGDASEGFIHEWLEEKEEAEKAEEEGEAHHEPEIVCECIDEEGNEVDEEDMNADTCKCTGIADDEIFNRARQFQVAQYQSLVYYHWLPAWLTTTVPAYTGYSSATHPGVTHVFQSAAMRWGHTLVTPGMFRRYSSDEAMRQNGNTDICRFPETTDFLEAQAAGFPAIRTCNTYFNPQPAVAEFGVEALFLGLASQRSEREDNIITPDLRGNVFGGLDASRRDLMSVNIQRGRDHGLPDYNTARAQYGLEVKEDFDVSFNSTLNDRLREVYHGNWDDVDIWPGGLLETTEDGRMGELFTTIILDQFVRIRDADRWWFENTRAGMRRFEDDELNTIRQRTFKDVLMLITNITDAELQDDVFHRVPLSEDSKGCVEEIHLSANDLEPCSPYAGQGCSEAQEDQDNGEDENGNKRPSGSTRCQTETFDYLHDLGSEGMAIGLAIMVFSAQGVMIALMYYLVQRRQLATTRVRQVEMRAPDNTTEDGVKLFGAIEHVSPSSQQKVYVSYMDNTLRVQDARKKVLREIDVDRLDKEVSFTESEPPCMLIKCKAVYDVYLTFNSIGDRAELTEVFEKSGTPFKLNQVVDQKKLNEGVKWATDRKKEYAEIFRVVFSDTFENFSGTGGTSEFAGATQGLQGADRAVLDYELSQDEFADAFTMDRNSLFLKQFFRMTDRDGSGTVSFQEFLEMMSVFAKGNTDQKLRVMFRMYDLDNNGTISSMELRTMLKASISINGSVDDAKMDSVVEVMYKTAGLPVNSEIDFDGFKRIMGEHEDVVGGINVAGRVEKKINRKRGGNFRQTVIARKKNPTAAAAAAANAAEKQEEAAEEAQDQPRKRVISFAGVPVQEDSDEDDSDDDTPAQRPDMKRTQSQPGDEDYNEAAAVEEAGDDLNRLSILYGGRTRTNTYNPRASSRRRQTIDPSAVVKPKAAAAEANAIDNNKPEFKEVAASPLEDFHAYVDNNKGEIFWTAFFVLATIWIFVERAWVYSTQSEQGGLRRIAGYGVTMTRGAASAQMWAYAVLLLPMCRNTISWLRGTFVNYLVPFDQAINFHILCAYTGGLFSVVHSIGHWINFYHISTQPNFDMTCLFREIYRRTDELWSFGNWVFNDCTGLTAFFLVVTFIIMYTFAQPYARRNIFYIFWCTHHLYILWYFLILTHGSAAIVQLPIFWYFLLGPLCLFTVDRLISHAHRTEPLEVLRVDMLPSDVVGIFFRKPDHWRHYVSGSWCRISSPEINSWDFHSITISSAPHEPFGSVHIRGVGPWSRRMREVYDPKRLTERPNPIVYVDGPISEGHRDWINNRVAVLVGGGIGVTPFASIIKDMVHQSKFNRFLPLEKLYFFWVTRSQRQFEWLIDIIRTVEDEDERDLFECHIFITQLFGKFDLRTLMLYVCERQFQKINGRSLFTGLQSITHFGRPDFTGLFGQLQEAHNDVPHIEVFSCGPYQMADGINVGCKNRNSQPGPRFAHIQSNF